MGERLWKNSSSLLDEITNQCTPGGWNEYLEETKIKYDITENTTEDEANNTSSKENILKAFKTRIEKEGGGDKSKINYFLEGHQGRKRYMLQLGRMQASTILKARTRMLHVKINYKIPIRI